MVRPSIVPVARCQGPAAKAMRYVLIGRVSVKRNVMRVPATARLRLPGPASVEETPMLSADAMADYKNLYNTFKFVGFDVYCIYKESACLEKLGKKAVLFVMVDDTR
ncbi:MAG: hypothetical protein AAB409_00735, partial [Gemmatimonadota bacterium]